MKMQNPSTDFVFRSNFLFKKIRLLYKSLIAFSGRIYAGNRKRKKNLLIKQYSEKKVSTEIRISQNLFFGRSKQTMV